MAWRGTSWFDNTVKIFDPIAWGTVKSYPYAKASGVIPINAVGFYNQIVVAELSEKGSRLAWLDPASGSTQTFAAMKFPTTPSSMAATSGIWASTPFPASAM